MSHYPPGDDVALIRSGYIDDKSVDRAEPGAGLCRCQIITGAGARLSYLPGADCCQSICRTPGLMILHIRHLSDPAS